MFEVFEALTLKELFEVCYGILACWNKESVAAARLSSNELTHIATSFAKRNKEAETKCLLLSYMNSRTGSIGDKGKEAGEAFLQRAYRQQAKRAA
ncbi:MAG: hypothetical protein FWE98_02495 [Oscillospiraceae bacterium]|nr:hypothetical protein [Oscillospiraceae bacterium]